ncbi:SHQ1 protein-domain-containing protein [Choanephora cucurbitarum]|nr:SHQ1 protein-domain-containing protein [Choanephora cucurbitarum]
MIFELKNSLIKVFFFFMITPTFKVDQDENSVFIVIDTPYVRAQDVDLYVEGTEFRFYLRPYFLRLHFPAPIIEDDDSKATYDPSAGQFTIRVSKETKGQHFEDLDLLTKLLARTGESTSTEEKKNKKPLIEVIGEASQEELQDAVDFNWELPQALPTEELTLTAHYGFNNQYNGYFRHVQETMNEINELSEPERMSSEERREARVAAENERFNEDHYCMDCLNDEIQQLIKYKTIYAKELKRVQKQKTTEQKPLIQEISDVADPQQTSLLAFTSKEEAMMRDLPRKEYLLSFEKVTYLGLVDLLFAYSYNLRTTEGDNNVESVWCIGKISPTLSSLEY